MSRDILKLILPVLVLSMTGGVRLVASTLNHNWLLLSRLDFK